MAQLTWLRADSVGGDVHQVHALQVEVNEELQEVGDVDLVRLVRPVQYGPTLEGRSGW